MRHRSIGAEGRRFSAWLYSTGGSLKRADMHEHARNVRSRRPRLRTVASLRASILSLANASSRHSSQSTARPPNVELDKGQNFCRGRRGFISPRYAVSLTHLAHPAVFFCPTSSQSTLRRNARWPLASSASFFAVHFFLLLPVASCISSPHTPRPLAFSLMRSRSPAPFSLRGLSRLA